VVDPQTQMETVRKSVLTAVKGVLFEKDVPLRVLSREKMAVLKVTNRLCCCCTTVVEWR